MEGAKGSDQPSRRLGLTASDIERIEQAGDELGFTPDAAWRAAQKPDSSGIILSTGEAVPFLAPSDDQTNAGEV